MSTDIIRAGVRISIPYLILLSAESKNIIAIKKGA